MADFNFMDLASRYLDRRLDPVNRFIQDPADYLTNRIEQRLDPYRPQQDQNTAETTATQAQIQYGPTIEQPPAQAVVPGSINDIAKQSQQAQPLRPVIPQNPTAADYTAKQESGSNPDIGYHFPQDQQGQRRSSAYGTYGITQPAYQDIQRADPYFQNRPIESLTRDEQTRAFYVDRENRSKQLKAFGIEPSEGNLNAAHFLGAKGLANYLQNGYISPQAAAANGGEERVRQIVQGRLQGQVSPASGATQAPVVQTAQEVTAATGTELRGTGFKLPGGYVEEHFKTINSGDRAKLLQLSTDPAVPPDVQRSALDKLYGDMTYDRNMAQAQQKFQEIAATGDVTKLKKASEDKETGSYFKAFLFARLGLNELAQQEQQKISPNYNYSPVMAANGQRYSAKFNKTTNELVGARDSEGNEVTDPKLLGSIASSALSSKGIGQSGAIFYRDSAGTQWSQIPTEQGPQFINISTGVAGRPVGKIIPITGGTDLDLAREKALIQLRKEIAGKNIKDQIDYLKERNTLLVGNGMAPITPQELGINLAPGVEAVGGAAAQQAAAATRPVSEVGRVAAPAVQAQTPGTIAVPGVPAARPTTGELKAGVAATKKDAEEFVKYKNEEVADKASKGSQINSIRKEQLYGPDGILQNPELVGFLQATGGTAADAGNILRDLIAGNFKSVDDLSGRIGQLNLSQRQKDVLYRQINLSRQIDPLTLKANAGAGAVSDAEQRANRQANIDITRQTLYSAATDMTRQQFFNDLGQAKLAFSNARPDLNTRAKFDAAWSAEKRKIEEQYAKIFEARAAYIQKYNPDGSRPGAVVDAFKHYPVPEYNSETGQWDLKTQYNRDAVSPQRRKPLMDLVR